jgi:hypothetical protein
VGVAHPVRHRRDAGDRGARDAAQPARDGRLRRR